ncbi:MAG: redoxin family protein [Planctomycetes bacterium]|nr:redoxin family protein [Planctomycetota bacterium]
MSHRPLVRAALALLLAVAGLTGAETADAGARRAGELFAGARGWLNTETPLTKDMLAGQVVLIDFWTYCCINCMHVMPDLKALEAKYHDQPLVVVGVHSGKFDQEKDLANIRAAVLRNHLVHPVAVDSDFAIWNRLGVRSWPTLALLDTHGNIADAWAGEGHRAEMDAAIAKAIAAGQADGSLAKAPLRFTPEHDAAADGVLAFPGKVLADAAGKRLFIADTAHHRVLVAGLDGAVQAVLGSGHPELADGIGSAAAFNEPEGLALSEDGQTLFVCDRQNHALRAVDLATRAVTTLAGNGEQGNDRNYQGPAKDARLNSPWDVVRVGTQLFIAMAGHHQIWSYDLAAQTIGVHAGSGREICTDGPQRTAAFAQPSGLAAGDSALYVADSEVSSVRAVDLTAAGRTRTLAGSGDLFGFGLVDGHSGDARFQHPLGVALGSGPRGPLLVVADTYNQRLRTVDPLSGEVATLALPGLPAPAGLFEPGGLSIAAGTIYVADTNHHRIVACALDGSGARVIAITLPKP